MTDVLAGDAFGPYRVIAPLGKGGMGEVYVASDERLGRRVALKLLPESDASDPSRRARFVAEARAASALQHPNIVTIFDIGHERGRDYFAMELVEGSSLRALIEKGKLPRERALTIAADIAAALAAAHASGIIHRDIKPENIIITPSGQAKVLDYGLAKMTAAPLTLAPDATTFAMSPSIDGAITGTVAYMSPEQAAGDPLDHRTDIFSLGTVLYEVLAGRHPFEAKTPIDRLHKIIHDDPKPLRGVTPSVPAAVADIVEKAMARDREWRYASAADLRLDLLRALRAPANVDAAVSSPSRRRAWAAVALGLIAILSIALAVALRRGAPRAPAMQRSGLRLVPLTMDGAYAGEPTFAPDGSTLAYVSDRSGNFEIYLKQISGGPDINLTNDPADDVQPSFSPDGREIAFVSSRGNRAPLVYPNARSPLIGGDIWVMSAFGGMARKVVERGNYPSWTADGKSLLFSKGPWNGQKIYRVSSLGGAAAEIPIRWADKHLFVYKPQTSPDGKWIVFGTQEERIYVVALAGGDAKLVARGWEPAWKTGGGAILFSDRDRNLSLSEVVIEPSTGTAVETRPVTIGRGRDAQPAISRDGRLIAFAAQQVNFNIERIRFDAEDGKTEGAPEVLTHGPALKMFFDISVDRRSLVYQARVNDVVHLWRADIGKEPVRLTRDDRWADNWPVWSPDGTQIAFVRLDSDGSRNPGEIWTIRTDGSTPRLVFRGNSGFIEWMPDGQGISYQSAADGQVYVFDLRTRTSRKITSDPRVRTAHQFTPDGQWLMYQVVGVDGSTDVNAMRASGGAGMAVIATPRDDYHPFASPSGRWVYAMMDHMNLVRVPGPAQGWRKAPPQQVTFFPETNLMLEDTRITSDGKWLYYSRKSTTGDIWVMTRSDGSRF